MNRNAARYVLRRSITPWNADELLDELIDFCIRNQVEEVAAIVDGEEFTHNLPTIEWVDAYMPVLQRAKQKLTDAGVVFSLNPWVTVVHCDRGRDIRATLPGVGLLTGHDGIQCTGCACHLSEPWQDLTRQIWQRYASLEPEVIWVEDDIRLINHQPVEYGCFCPLHMRALGDRLGREIAREELVAALLAPGQPGPLRAAWLDLNRDLIIDLGRFYERIVHEISPATRIGLMCSPPDSHAIEGRDWGELMSALSGDTAPVARPCMMNYSEVSLRGLYDSELMLRQTRHCLGPGVEVHTEVESIPFTAYSKSARFTFLQMALSFVLGADGVTLNLFDHMGSSMSVSPELAELLRSKKSMFNAIASRCKGGTQRGVQLIHEPLTSYHVHLEPGSAFQRLGGEGHAWSRVLSPLGIPYTYEPESVAAISGEMVRAIPRHRLTELFGQGVLLDLTALRCLEEMGLSEHTGVGIRREFRKYDRPVSAEEFMNPDFGGAMRRYLTLTLPDLGGDVAMAELDLLPGAIQVSRVVDPDTNPVCPFVTVYENALGGRVCVFAIDLSAAVGAAFLNPYRKQQISRLCSWLSRDSVPLEVSGGAYPLPFRVDHAHGVTLGTFNLCLDPWPEVRYALPPGTPPVTCVQKLTEEGSWLEHDAIRWDQGEDGSVSIVCTEPLEAARLLALTVCFGNKSF